MNQEVLIVDDEPRITDSLKFIFENRGFRVQTSSNGLEAIGKFKKSPVKVILTDIQMPKMNGFDLFHAVKKMDPFVQLIVFTGYADLENTKKAFKQEVFEFFKKPITDNNILFTAVEMADSKYDQLKKEHETKQKNERTLQTISKIFDSLEAIVYVADMETHELIYANKKFNNELGYSDDKSFAGEKCWKVIQKNQTGPCPFCTNSRIVDGNGLPTEPFEWEYFNKKNHKLFRVIDKAIEWGNGRIVRLEIAYDNTQKRKYEKLFKQYEKTYENLKKLESLGTLAGGIAHQFNNSLSVLNGHLDLMDMKFPGNLQLKNHIHSMLKSTENMTQLTALLLAYARGGKYQTQTFILSTFIEETLEQLKYKRLSSINLITDFSARDCHVMADKLQIQMLLSAVWENACEATGEVGTIKLVCAKEKPDQVDFEKVKRKLDKEYVCLSIIDGGPGMDNETKERIFEPFFTTKFAGRGLGLSAVYGIVKSHNGFISIKSQPETGTMVKIFLPITRVDEPTRLESPIHPAKQSLTILLIEDEEAVRKVTKMMIERLGHSVLEASTGKNAITLLKSHKGIIHLALLDFYLPDMNGDVVYPFLVKTHPEMDTIILSGYAITEPVQKMLNAGAKAFVQKPVTMAELYQIIATVAQTGWPLP